MSNLFSNGRSSVLLLDRDLDIYPFKEVERLNRLLQERDQTEKRITGSLREKETLLKEVHHRVKNNFQIISSLLSLQADSIQDQGSLQVFAESQSRIRAIALVHEKLYASADFFSIDMEAYMGSLAGHLVQAYTISDRIGFKMNIGRVMIGIDQAIPCGLILNELITNAVKYAFPAGRKGEVIIELRQESEKQLVLIVRDTGIGMPAHRDSTKVDSIGLRLVEQLVEQIQGHLQVEFAGGTVFTIRFPLLINSHLAVPSRAAGAKARPVLAR